MLYVVARMGKTDVRILGKSVAELDIEMFKQKLKRKAERDRDTE